MKYYCAADYVSEDGTIHYLIRDFESPLGICPELKATVIKTFVQDLMKSRKVFVPTKEGKEPEIVVDLGKGGIYINDIPMQGELKSIAIEQMKEYAVKKQAPAGILKD